MKVLKTIILGRFILLSLISCAVSKSISDDFILEEPLASDAEDSEYEIVPIHRSRIQKRDAGRGIHLSLKAFGEHIKLWLEPYDGMLATEITPLYYINPDGYFGKYKATMKDIVDVLYEDAKEAATMIITKLPNGNYKLDGIIGGKRLAIRPISNKNNYKKYKRFVDNIPESERGNYTYHIVSKLPEVPDHLKTLQPPSLKTVRSKRSVPDVIFPELLIVVDYSLFKKFNGQHYDIVKYVLAFWNSVDFIYRDFRNPKIRLNIAGIIIAEGSKSLKYMQYIQKKPYGLLVSQALHQSAHLVRELEELLSGKTNFDALVTLSSTKFVTKNDNENTETIGMTYTNGACGLPEVECTPKGCMLTTFKSALIHDEGGCAKVHTAAHELGHLLGAQHDGTANRECKEENGLLMAPAYTINANSSDWSYCSVQDIENFLNSQQSECLFNRPKFGKRISRFLPGKIADVDTQCKYLGNLHAIENDETICVKLVCRNANGESYLYQGASDGSSCGENKICLHKQCVDIDKITY